VKIGTDAASGGPAAAWSRRRRYAGRNPLLRGSRARGGVGVGGSGPGLGTAEASSLPWIPSAVELGPANCSASASYWFFRRPWSSRGTGELRGGALTSRSGPSTKPPRPPHHRDRIPARPWLPLVSSAPPGTSAPSRSPPGHGFLEERRRRGGGGVAPCVGKEGREGGRECADPGRRGCAGPSAGGDPGRRGVHAAMESCGRGGRWWEREGEHGG
jgi:hypothetical protein